MTRLATAAVLAAAVVWLANGVATLAPTTAHLTAYLSH